MISTPPWPTATHESLLGFLLGNVDAVHMVETLARSSHIYDDLIDQDKPVAADGVHELVWRLLVELPLNPFYRQHQDAIRPVLITAILNWQAATDIERDGIEEELHVSHALRYALADVLLLAMTIVGGRAHAMAHARAARLSVQADTWANYRSEHFQEESQHAQPHLD